MVRYYSLLFAAICTAMCGCAVNTQNQLTKAGHAPLTAEELYQLTSGHTLRLTSADFDGKLYVQGDGTFSAQNSDNRKDVGEWDIRTDDTLCLEFSKWFFGDLRCYSVFSDPEGSGFIFFTANGARRFSAEKQDGDPERLATAGKKPPSSYLKDKSGTADEGSPPPSAAPAPVSYTPEPAPLPSRDEMKHMMVKTAGNCPDCNLSGADLSRGDLVEANLTGANLSGANLSKANLRRANLAGADLSGADLTTANLPGANLTNCNLRNADLSGANLIQADLTGAQTQGAIFKGSLLEGTKGLK